MITSLIHHYYYSRSGSDGGDEEPTILFMIEPHENLKTDKRIEVYSQPHMDCTVYAVAVANGDSTPTGTQVKAGQNSSGAAAIASANGAYTGLGGKILNLTGLTKATTYKICVYCEDGADFSEVYTVNIATISTLKDLPGAIFDWSGENVTVTGSDIDVIVNNFFPGYFNAIPRSTGKPVLEATGGANSLPSINFDGTAKVMFSGLSTAVPDAFDLNAFTIHLIFKANNTTTRQCVISNLITASSPTSGSRGFRLEIAGTSNNITFGHFDQAQALVPNLIPFTNTTNHHLLTIRYRSITDGTSVLQVYLDGVIAINVSNLNRIGMPIDTPMTLGGFTTAGNTFPLNAKITRQIGYFGFHSNEEINFAITEFNTKYGFSIPTL
jgi:hypothetical protein